MQHLNLKFAYLRTRDVCLDDLKNTLISKTGNEYFLDLGFHFFS